MFDDQKKKKKSCTNRQIVLKNICGSLRNSITQFWLPQITRDFYLRIAQQEFIHIFCNYRYDENDDTMMMNDIVMNDGSRMMIWREGWW
jgi:hypothetical protein